MIILDLLQKIESLEAELKQLKEDKTAGPAEPDYPDIEVVETDIRFRRQRVFIQAVKDRRKSEELARKFSERIDEMLRIQNHELFGTTL